MTIFDSYIVAHRDSWSGIDEDGKPIKLDFTKYEHGDTIRLRFEGPRRRFSVSAAAALFFLRETALVPPTKNRPAGFRFPMVNNRDFERSLVRRGVLCLERDRRRRCLELGLDLRDYEPGPRLKSFIRWLEKRIAREMKRG